MNEQHQALATITLQLTDEHIERIAERVAAKLREPTKKDPLTLNEAADELRCCTRQVRRYIAQGRLHAEKTTHGGSSRLLIPRASLEALKSPA